MSLSLSPHGSRAGPSPQLGAGLPRQSPSPQPDLDSNGGHTRSLSRSERLLAHLPTSFSEHLSRHASRSPDSIATSLAHVGLTLASPGSDYLTHRLSVSEINIGAQAFLTELNRVAINARTESQRTGLQRVNTSFVQGTIQLVTEPESEREGHAITEATDNPFDPIAESLPPLSPVTSNEADKINEFFIKDIVPHYEDDGHHPPFMRARLDSGMEDNAISEEKADETGFEWEKYTGRDILTGNGQVFTPLGYVELPFHFKRIQSAKTWTVRFLIFPSPPFDVAFGRNFIYKAGLFQPTPGEALPMEYRPLSERERRERQADIARSDRYSSSKQSEQDRKYAERRSKPSDKSSSKYSSSRRG